VARLRRLAPASIWASRLPDEHHLMKKGNGFVAARQLFAGGADYRRAVLQGSAKIDKYSAADLAASALTLVAALDPAAGVPLATRVLLAPESSAPLQNAAAAGITATSAELVETLLLAFLAAAPARADHAAGVTLANGGPGRALARAPFAGTGARLQAQLAALTRGRRQLDGAELVRAEALTVLLWRRGEVEAIELLHALRAHPVVSLAHAARDALLRLGGEAALGPLAAELGVGRDPIGAVMAVLSSPGAYDRLAPFFADDRRLAEPAAAEVVQATLWKLERDSVEARQGWVRADPRWVELLVRLALAGTATADALDVAATWRRAAVTLLGLAGDARATPALLSLFGKVDAPQLCNALRATGDRSIVPALRPIAAGAKTRADRKVVEELIAALSA
jgi:hypothetical protein